MTRATWLWLRRSTAGFLLPALVLVAVAAPFSRSGWQYEWMWAGSSVAGGTVLLGALISGLVAHDRANKLRGIAECEVRSVRGVSSGLAMPLASLLLAFGAWLVAACVVAVRVWLNGVGGLPDWWPATESVAVIFANVGLGFMVGSWLQSKAAGAVGVVASYGIGALALQFGLAGVLLQAGGATGSLVGLERPATFTWSLVFVNLAFGAMCLAIGLVRAGRTQVGLGRLLLAGVSVLVFLGSVAQFHRITDRVDPYVLRVEPTVCVGKGPRFCGPESSRALLDVSAPALDRAAESLRAGGLDLASRYSLPVGMKRFPPDSGVLSINPDSFSNGGLGRSDLLLTFQTPVDCADYHATQPTNLLKQQAVVQQWIGAVLDGKQPTMTSAVAEAYAQVTRCAPYQGPL